MNFLLDILFPIKCLGSCGAWDNWLCAECLQKINKTNKILLTDNEYITGLYYICEYKNPLIQKLIHQLKYGYSQEIALILGKQIKKEITEKFDYIIPVPLHKKRFCERGFNQAELIAKNIDKNKTTTNIISRPKYTKAQAQLKEADRQKNTKNAFKFNNDFKHKLNNKKILLVDDVYTTGNTLSEIAKILATKNTAEIWAAVIAKG